LFPSEVTRIRKKMITDIEKTKLGHFSGPVLSNGLPASWATSTVSNFGSRYNPPLTELSMIHSVEALVEGSDMSQLREGSPMSPEYAWRNREGRLARYEGKRVGGTVVVHFIKKNMWYLETALALLEGDDHSEAEKYERNRHLEMETERQKSIRVREESTDAEDQGASDELRIRQKEAEEADCQHNAQNSKLKREF